MRPIALPTLPLWPAGSPALRWVPIALTLAGLVLGLVSSALPAPWAIVALTASQVADLLDGAAARRLEASSVFGRWLDWFTDALLAAFVALTFWPAPIAAAWLVLLVPWWAYATARDHRISGRFVSTLITIAILAGRV